MTKSVLILLFPMYILAGCHSAKEEAFHFYPSLNDTSMVKKKFIEQRLEEYEYFNLPDITNGSTDSLEIRIWPNYAFDITKNVFIFRLNKTIAKGLHYNSFMLPIITEDGIINRKTDLIGLGDSVFVVKKITPICGWKKFYDSINYFKLSELPSQADIKGFELRPTLDGYGYIFEFATPDSFRCIVYGDPHIYDYEECKAVSGFIEMFKRQLGNDFDWPLNVKVPSKN